MVKRRLTMMPGTLFVTDKEFQVIERFGFAGSVEQYEICEWMKFHGIDPMTVPLESPIHREESTHTITYLYTPLNEEGRVQHDPMDPSQILVVTEQEKNEAGPLPWPDSILAHKVETEVDEEATDAVEVASDVSRRIGAANRSTLSFEGPGDDYFSDIIDGRQPPQG